MTLLYVIWYARRVIKNPDNSMMTTKVWQQQNDSPSNSEVNLEGSTVSWRDIVVSLVVVTPIILALGMVCSIGLNGGNGVLLQYLV